MSDDSAELFQACEKPPSKGMRRRSMRSVSSSTMVKKSLKMTYKRTSGGILLLMQGMDGRRNCKNKRMICDGVSNKK